MPATITRLPVSPAENQPSAKPPKKPKNVMPDGRKRIRIDVGTDPVTGKRIRKTFVGKTLKECNQKRDAWLAAQKSPPTSDLTVSDWIDRWLQTYGQNAGYSTNRSREADARKLADALGPMRLKDVCEVHVQELANSMADRSKSGVTKLRQTVQDIFSRAVANDLIRRNPCAGVSWQHAGEGTHRFLEPWEINLITDHASVHFAGTWAMLMLYAGLRRGEALALEWSDVDFARGVIHVQRGVHFEGNTPVVGAPKTQRSVRDVPLIPVLRAHLERLSRVSQYVCTGAHGQQVSDSIWTAGWRTFNRTMANILNGDTARPVAPGRRSDRDTAPRRAFSVRAHDLRHTYASMLFEAGVDIKTAQKLLGHATPELTMRIYTHLSDRQERNSLDKLVSYVSAMRGTNGAQCPENP